MITRALKFKMLCGAEGIIPLPETTLDKVKSTEEFINQIKLYREGIRRFNDRNPMLEWSTKKETFKTLGLVIHDLINARKFINHQLITLDGVNQLFCLDFTTETITLCETDTHEELGQMHINIIFDNWAELFYPTWTVIPVEEEEEEEEVPNTSVYDHMRPKMQDALGSLEFELWDYLFSILGVDGNLLNPSSVIHVHYSGGGDSGDIDSVTIYEKMSDIAIKMGTKAHDLFDSDTVHSIERLIWDVIDSKEGGFYNNEGGYGEMTIGISKFEWTHSNYIQSEEQTVAEHYDFDDELPEEVREAMSATAPETKSEVTLADIVTEHHESLMMLKDLEE